MGVPNGILQQTVTRQRAGVTENALGEKVNAWTGDTQALLVRLVPLDGRPKFGSAMGRTELSTHRMIYNLSQYADDPDGPPFATVATPSDVAVGDRILEAGGDSYRVDWVEDVENDHDHFEALLTRFGPGGESGT